MCDPVSIIGGVGLLLSVGSEIVSHNAQNDDAEANRRAAMQALRIERQDLGVRQQEEYRAAQESIARVNREAAGVQGAATASAAEAGVTGNSVDAQRQDIERSRAEAEQTIRDNAVVTIDQLQRYKLAGEATAASRIAAVPRSNPFATGLRIAGHGLDYATTIYNRQPRVRI